MKVIYVAGPYMAATAFEIQGNVRAAAAVGLEIALAGAMPLIPHTNTGDFHDQPIDVAFWYEGTLELMRRCDGAVFLPTWRNSKGARGEWLEAQTLKIPVHEWSNRYALREWLGGGAE